jgi:hypothetical protein
LTQRAQDPPEALPTAPAGEQKLPTLTVPGTVTDAEGALFGVAVLAEALAATVDACFLPPHPVSTTAALRTTPVRASGRFIGPPSQVTVRD